MIHVSSLSRYCARLVTVAGVAMAATWTAAAEASEEYPQVIADTLEMPCVPACTLCHTSLAGGLGTIRSDVNGASFGLRLIAAGVRGEAPNRVPDALAAIEADPSADLDGDMVTDIAELRAGADPNEPGEGNVCGGGPTYGCGARIAPSTTLDVSGGAAALGAVLALVFAARRRRAR